MKTRFALLALAILGAFFSGCVSTSDKLNDVRIGMTKDEVIALMGKPDSMSAQANVEYLTYYLVSESGYGRDQPYMVRLANGRVESFGRFLQLFDLYNRPVTGTSPGEPGSPVGPNPGYGAAPALGSPDLAGQILKLKALKDQGILTDDEFQKAKQKLLSPDQK